MKTYLLFCCTFKNWLNVTNIIQCKYLKKYKINLCFGHYIHVYGCTYGPIVIVRKINIIFIIFKGFLCSSLIALIMMSEHRPGKSPDFCHKFLLQVVSSYDGTNTQTAAYPFLTFICVFGKDHECTMAHVLWLENNLLLCTVG